MREPTSPDPGRTLETLRPQVLRLCLRYANDPARAEELTQDALMVAVRRWDTFTPGTSLRAWLFQIARNLCRNAARKRRETLTDDGVVDPVTSNSELWRALRRAERSALVRQAIETLPREEQEVAYLRYEEGLAPPQIDAVLGLGGSGSRAVLQRCKRRLRAEVLRLLEEAGHGTSFFDSRD